MRRLLFASLSILLLTACGPNDKKLHTDAVQNRASMPVLDTYEVTTLISDSGITRYRITTPEWLIFDKDTPVHWLFPKGIYLEKFEPDTFVSDSTEGFYVDASLQADSAYYNYDAEEWILVGNVHALNLDSEQFDSPCLRWERRSESILSDTTIQITKKKTIIRGIGFRSNQQMTQYTIIHPTGIIPIEEEKDSTL